MTENEAREVLAHLLGELRVFFTTSVAGEPIASLTNDLYTARELQAVIMGLARMRETGVPL